ncbi:hypothetical protein [Rubrivirga sp. IMCC43871]|uniref:hypothetical protein n=1 Tax=Rubrivirga sp. IMCC43871 TaxID=3391575 RepID=UPI00399025F8
MRTLLLAALVLAACDSTASGPPDVGGTYRVESASLDGDVLTAVVSYSGGCQEHTFEPRSRSAATATELWLVHDAHNDTCEAYLTETLALAVVSDGPTVLLTPSGGEIRLR